MKYKLIKLDSTFDVGKTQQYELFVKEKWYTFWCSIGATYTEDHWSANVWAVNRVKDYRGKYTVVSEWES